MHEPTKSFRSHPEIFEPIWAFETTCYSSRTHPSLRANNIITKLPDAEIPLFVEQPISFGKIAYFYNEMQFKIQQESVKFDSMKRLFNNMVTSIDCLQRNYVPLECYCIAQNTRSLEYKIENGKKYHVSGAISYKENDVF